MCLKPVMVLLPSLTYLLCLPFSHSCHRLDGHFDIEVAKFVNQVVQVFDMLRCVIFEASCGKVDLEKHVHNDGNRSSLGPDFHLGLAEAASCWR